MDNIKAKARKIIKDSLYMTISICSKDGKPCYAKKLLTKKTDITRFVKEYRDFQRRSPLRMYKAVPEKFYKLAPSKMYNEKFVDSRLDVDLK